MAKKKEYENYLVEAKNEAMRAKMPYSTLEQKVAALVIACVNPKDDKLKKYTFQTIEILRLLKLGKNYQALYEITEGLLKNPIIIKKPDGGIYQSNIIADADYSDDRSSVTFTIAETMQKYLIQITQGEYTRFYLSNILGLTSKYSIAMYRFLKSFEVQKCVTKPIEELKFSLGMESTDYEGFGEFKRRVLDMAQEELEEKTDIRFTYTTETKRKKVLKLTFTVNWNPNNETKIALINQAIGLKEKDLEEAKEKRDQIKIAVAESLRQAQEAKQNDNLSF
jgi:plasmid replication initiation protein